MEETPLQAAKRIGDAAMTEPTPDTIERRLRDLASYFTGTRMSHRLPQNDHGPARLLGVTYVNDAGEDCDVGEELLSIADDLAQLDGLRVRRHP